MSESFNQPGRHSQLCLSPKYVCDLQTESDLENMSITEVGLAVARAPEELDVPLCLCA